MAKWLPRRAFALGWLAVIAISHGAFSRASAESPQSFKEAGPTSVACDIHAKGTPQWKVCVGGATSGMSDTELFYAGYWLARNGQYREALAYLELASIRDERILTYMGFAKRKLGDVHGALPLYVRALEINPDYSVARAYLGEAFLVKGEPEGARIQLAEIERRCGKTCAEYADLAGHIARFDAALRREG